MLREPGRDSIDVSQAPGQHRWPDPTQANMVNFTTTTTTTLAAATNCKWKSKQPAVFFGFLVFGFWFSVLWLRFHNMTAATASALVLHNSATLQQCNTATVQEQQMFCSFLAISIGKQSRHCSTAKGHKMCYSLLLVV